jgi:HEAT repeat protein
VPESYLPDGDLRVQALGMLIQTDAQKVIPLLRNIALENENPSIARRAVFVLAQSRNPEAQMIVLDVARRGPDPVRLAAVRELGRFGAPDITRQLLDVYTSASLPLKRQVVLALGERADSASLLQIARSEKDDNLRNIAITTLGRAGGREQLRVLYSEAPRRTRHAIIRGLFNARDEDGLIRIADQEKDAQLRAEALSRLRLMGTPKAKAYLEKFK